MQKRKPEKTASRRWGEFVAKTNSNRPWIGFVLR